MTGVFYTSDLHLGHGIVSILRGFDVDGDPAASSERHDMTILDNWNAAVSKRDTVYVLGDLTLQNPKRWIEYVNELNGRKHFISGNHDPVWPGHRDWHKHLPTYLEMFESVTPFARRKLDGKNVLLSHFPYRMDHTMNARFDQYRLKDQGGWLLHGHTHGKVKWTNQHEIHIGLDAWDLTPVAEPVLIDMMRAGAPWL